MPHRDTPRRRVSRGRVVPQTKGKRPSAAKIAAARARGTRGRAKRGSVTTQPTSLKRLGTQKKTAKSPVLLIKELTIKAAKKKKKTTKVKNFISVLQAEVRRRAAKKR